MEMGFNPRHLGLDLYCFPREEDRPGTWVGRMCSCVSVCVSRFPSWMRGFSDGSESERLTLASSQREIENAGQVGSWMKQERTGSGAQVEESACDQAEWEHVF